MNDMIDDNPSFVQKKKQERMYRKWYWYQVPYPGTWYILGTHTSCKVCVETQIHR